MNIQHTRAIQRTFAIYCKTNMCNHATNRYFNNHMLSEYVDINSRKLTILKKNYFVTIIIDEYGIVVVCLIINSTQHNPLPLQFSK